MNAFFRMHAADKKQDFFAVGQGRRRARSLRFRSWVWHDRNLRFEIGHLFHNCARQRPSKRLQSSDVAIKAHLAFRVAAYVDVNFSTLGRAQQNRQPKRVRNDDVGGGENRENPDRVNKIEKFQPDDRPRGVESRDTQMLHAAAHLRARKLRDGARNDQNLVAASRKFLCKREPDFFHSAAHDRRYWKKGAQDDGNFHGSFKIRKSESAARSIAKRCSKQCRALPRIASRSADGVSIQRSSKRVVPARSSDSIYPARAARLARQTFYA